MNPSKLLDSKVVKFYGSSILHSPDRKLITDQSSKAFNEGKEARRNGLAVSENPYRPEDDKDVLWTRYDCWIEGYNFKETF